MSEKCGECEAWIGLATRSTRCAGCGIRVCGDCYSAGEVRGGKWFCNLCCRWGDEITANAGRVDRITTLTQRR